MTIDEVSAYVVGLGGVLVLEPGPGDGSPEISWGDRFFYYAPDGVLPTGQPFATVITKDYPDDIGSRLNRPGAFRVNLSAGTEDFTRSIGRTPREPVAASESDPATDDVVIAHPVYGSLGWLAVTNPGPQAGATLRDLLNRAHRRARTRHERRTGDSTMPIPLDENREG